MNSAAEYLGKTINGRYQIEKQIGKGGMAFVFKAYDIIREKNVAIKIIQKEAFAPNKWDRVTDRFFAEARTLAKLSDREHPNIVSFLDYGEYNGEPYIVMELLGDNTLSGKMNRKFSISEAAEILAPVADGLYLAHRSGIVHRDVKPSNIMYHQGKWVLTDFGIAKDLDSGDGKELTEAGHMIGTPEYVSPEQCLGARDLDGRSDEYSLGIIFYEMITGKKPFTAESGEDVIRQQIFAEVPKPEGVPEDVEKILCKALEKDPAKRYPTIKEFGAELKKLIDQQQDPEIETDPGDSASTLENPVSVEGMIPEFSSSDDRRENPDGQGKKTSNNRYAVFILVFIIILAGCGGILFFKKNRSSTGYPVEIKSENLLVTETSIFTHEFPGSLLPSETSAPDTGNRTFRVLASETPTAAAGKSGHNVMPSETQLPVDEHGVYIDSCPMKSFLKKGDKAEVAITSGLLIRESPFGTPTGNQAFSGKEIDIISDPVCVNGVVWYKVNFIGHEGWCMEGKDGEYYLCKADSNKTVLPDLDADKSPSNDPTGAPDGL